MSTLVLRSVKGAALTSTEIDTNFDNLNTGKVESATPVFSGLVTLPSQSIALTESNLPDVAPTLNLDFANSKQLDSRITFGRGSGGAYYDGKTTAMAEQNLLTYSQAIGGTGWTNIGGAAVSSNSIIAPDGTTTASTITGTVSGYTTQYVLNLSSTLAPSSTLQLTYSVYLQAGTISSVRVYFYNNSGGGNSYATFNLSNSTYVLGSLATAATVTQIGTTNWYRCTVTGICPGAGYATAVLYADNGYYYAWGAQLEQRSSVTAYTPTTTAPITNYIPVLLQAPLNTPRFDHDSRPTFNGTCTVSGSAVTLPATFADGSSPSTINKFYTGSITISGTAYVINNYVGSTRVVTVTGSPTAGAFSLVNKNYGQSLGLLIEEQRTNLTYPSSGLPASIFSANVTANAAVSPIGLSAILYAPTSAPSSSNIQYYIPNLTTGTTYTASFYIKNYNYDVISIYHGGAGGANKVGINITFSTMAIGPVYSGTGVAPTNVIITSVPNNWYKVSYTYIGTITGSDTITFRNISSSIGNGLSGVFIDGIQIEAASFATSYIPTTIATVTRNADVAYMTGTNFSSWYNQNEGSFFVEHDILMPAGAGNSILIGGSISTQSLVSLYSADPITRSYDGTTLTNVGNDIRYKANKVAISINGTLLLGTTNGLAVASSTWSKLSILSMLGIGSNGGGGSSSINSHIKKLTYYPKALSAPQLQGLTKL